MSSPTTLTRPRPTVWQITLSSPPDNRLTPPLLASLAANLDIVEAEWRRSGGGASRDPKGRGKYAGAGALVLTSNCGKFFSNGLDWEKSLTIKNFFEGADLSSQFAWETSLPLRPSDIYDPVMYRLMTFPLLTIGAINGHAFAGGMVLALCTDHRFITSGKGLVCMNEITFGSALPNSFCAFLSAKIPGYKNLRDTLLAKRWTQSELLKIGLVDEIVDDVGKEGVLVQRAVEFGVKEGPRIGAGSWGLIKDGVYHGVLDASNSLRQVRYPAQEAEAFWARVGEGEAKAKL